MHARLHRLVRAGALALAIVWTPTPSSFALDLAQWEDPSGSATIETVSSDDGRVDFQPLAGPHFGVTSSHSAWWIRVRPGPAADSSGGVLYLSGRQLDDVQTFLPGSDGNAWQRFVTGQMRSFSTRAIRDPAFVFPLPAELAGESLYVRLAGRSSLATRVEVLTEPLFRERQFQSYLAFGIYYAFVGSLVIYNLILLLSVRDIAYLGYVIYLACITLFHATIAGHAPMLLWPESPWWGERAATIVALTSLLGSLILSWVLCDARSLALWIQRGFFAAAAFALLVMLVGFVDPPLAVRIGMPFIAVLQVLGFVPIVAALRRGYRPARFPLVGLVILAPGILLWGANFRGLIPPSFVGEHALKLTVALEALLFAFALAERIRLAQEGRHRAERRLVDAQRSLSQKLLEAQDEERERIARHLHDGLGQPLTALSNGLERRFSGQAGAQELIDMARGAIDDTRKLSRDLHPHQLDLLGLPDAVRALAHDSLEPLGIETTVEIDEVGKLPAPTSLHLYRIVQEALTNVLRHAHASAVRVALRGAPGELELQVEDDGIGGVPTPGGFGTASIVERARTLGGVARYEPGEQGGLRLVVTVPR